MVNELPSLALLMVLEHLPTGDLVRCRRVNKLWRHLIDHSVIKRQLVLFVESDPRPHWWVHRGGEAIDLEEAIQANYAVFESETFFGLFKRVRRMFLSFNNFYFKQEWADKFANHFGATLEHLQIDYEATTSLSGSRTEFRMALKNLLTFCFSERSYCLDFPWPFTIRVDSNRLTHLYDDNSDLVFRSNTFIARIAPNLRELFVQRIIYEEPLEFPNLQRLGCCNPPSSSFLTACLPSLREFYFPTNFAVNRNEVSQSVRALVWRTENEARNLDVFWFGMKFTQENLTRNLYAISQIAHEQERYPAPVVTAETLDYFRENRSIFNFYHLRYGGQYSIFYSDSFADRLDVNMDRELVESLRANLFSVFTWDLKREFDVPKLAGLFQCVSRALMSSIGDRQQYEHLSTIFPNLRRLTLGYEMPKELDFSFLSRFKSLFALAVMRPLSLLVVDQILTNCQYLYGFTASSQESENPYFVRRGYRHIIPPEKRFDVRFPSLESEAVFFKEKEEVLEYLAKNRFALK